MQILTVNGNSIPFNNYSVFLSSDILLGSKETGVALGGTTPDY